MVNIKMNGAELSLATITDDTRNKSAYSLFDLKFHVPANLLGNVFLILKDSNGLADIVRLNRDSTVGRYNIYSVVAGQHTRVDSDNLDVSILFLGKNTISTNALNLPINIDYYQLTRQVSIVDELGVEIRGLYNNLLKLTNELLNKKGNE